MNFIDVEILLRGFMEGKVFVFFFLDEEEVSWKVVGKCGWESIKNGVTGILGYLNMGLGTFLSSRL